MMVVILQKNVNRLLKILFVLTALSLSLAAPAAPIRLDEQFDEKSAPTTRIRIKNFGKVNDRFYRGSLPKQSDCAALAALGVKTIISLRHRSDDCVRQSAGRADARYINLPMNVRGYPPADLAPHFLALVNDPENWPVYVYCLAPAARIIVKNLARRQVKAFLTTFGISISVALLATGFYLYYDAISRVVDVVFRTVYREDVSVVFNELRLASARYDIAHLPGVTRVEAHRNVPARLRFGHRARRLALTGMESGAELWRVVDGDYRVHEPHPNGVARRRDNFGATSNGGRERAARALCDAEENSRRAKCDRPRGVARQLQ